MTILEHIRDKYPGMTKKQREVADYMLDHPEDMCFTTLKQLSIDVKVSEVTILNTCSALGYSSFNELKYDFRSYVAAMRRAMVQSEDTYQLPYIPEGEMNDKTALLKQVCQDEMNLIKVYMRDLNLEDYFKAARMICDAKRVVLCGRGVSYQVVEYLMTRLIIAGVPAIAVNTELSDSVQSALVFIRRNTLVVPVSLPDYYFMTVKLAQYARDKGASVLGIADSKDAPIAEFCAMCLYCHTDTRYFLNTISGTMMLVNFLTTALSVEMKLAYKDADKPSKEFAKYFADGD